MMISLMLLFVLALAVFSGSQSVVRAQGGGTAGDTPYFTTQTVVLGNGTSLDKMIITGPPIPPAGSELQRTAVALPEPNPELTTNSLIVPAFNWVFGCSAVSGSMIAGYYDRNGFPNMYTGPTDGGVMPLDNSSWGTWSDGVDTYPNIPLAASHDGVDGRVGKGSIDDYWVQYNSAASDPYITGSWTQHTWGDAIGDYMKTSQSAYGNKDGSTTFYNYTTSASPLTCADMLSGGVSTVDGTYGRKLFYEARGYTVTTCYSQKTDNTVAGGFSYAQFKAEIDAGRPVMLNLAGHTIVGVGYNDPDTIYIHDTWDYLTYPMTWGTSYNGMQLLSVSIVNLAGSTPTVPVPVLPTGTITDTTPTYKWTTVAGATQYRYQLLKGATLKYTKTVLASACGAATCLNTPTTVLAAGAYKWRVQAMVGGTWGSYSAYKTFTLTLIPTPKSPSGTITDTTPTYKWTKVTVATQYRYELMKGIAVVYTKTVGSSACGAATCANTPTTVLSAGAYKWRVQAMVGGKWGAYSAYKAFSLTVPNTKPKAGFWSGYGTEFHVTTNQANVNQFAIYISVPACGITGKITRNSLVPIVNKSFSFSGSFYANGTFSSTIKASGKSGLSSFYIAGCGNVSGGPWSWTATWLNSSQDVLPTILNQELFLFKVDQAPTYYEVNVDAP
jgi:hypothetical protein